MQNRQATHRRLDAPHDPIMGPVALPALPVDAFLRFVEAQDGNVAQRLRCVLRQQGQPTQSLPELIGVLQTTVQHHWSDMYLHEDNPYINKQLGEARSLYVDMLRQRYEGARSLLMDALRIARESESDAAASESAPQQTVPAASNDQGFDAMAYFFSRRR